MAQMMASRSADVPTFSNFQQEYACHIIACKETLFKTTTNPTSEETTIAIHTPAGSNQANTDFGHGTVNHPNFLEYPAFLVMRLVVSWNPLLYKMI